MKNSPKFAILAQSQRWGGSHRDNKTEELKTFIQAISPARIGTHSPRMHASSTLARLVAFLVSMLMNYSIHIPNQPALIALGLDLVDGAIIDAIRNMLASSKIEEFVYRGTVYKWVAPAKIIADQPAIGIKKRAVMERLRVLESKGIIERCPQNQVLAKAYYRAGKAWDSLSKQAEPMQENAQTYAPDCIGGMQEDAQGGMQEDAHYPNTNNPTTNNPSKGASPYSETFEKMWEYYGRVGNKQKAYKAFKRLTKAELQEVRQAMPKYLKYLKAKDAPFPMHLSTYIGSNKRWQDELPAPGNKTPSFAASSKTVKMTDWNALKNKTA